MEHTLKVVQKCKLLLLFVKLKRELLTRKFIEITTLLKEIIAEFIAEMSRYLKVSRILTEIC